VKNTTSWTIGITLPFTFPFYDNTDFREERAQLGLSSMKAELERNNADKKWTEAKNDWARATSRLNEIWNKDMALADVLVESSLASYRSGKVGFADLVLARRTKIDLKVEELQLKAQRLIAKSICLTQCDE
jgi:outer membrane protein TolC